MNHPESILRNVPKSKIVERGYINIYSVLNPKEQRQIAFKRKYKMRNPLWEDTMVYLSNLFARKSPKNAVVMDAGCGNGNYIIDENRDVIAWAAGVDVSKDFTKNNICLDEIQEASLESLPFEDNSFDVVVSLWVLEHLENPSKVFKEISRVLKPDGVFMFATSNRDYLPLKLMDRLKFEGLNHLINKVLFGRDEKEVFEAFYRANNLKALDALAEGVFQVEELRLNSDVSYTSFNTFTYKMSCLAVALFTGYFSKFISPHIVGVFRNTKS